MKLFGKRIVQDQKHNSRGPWFARVLCLSILLAPAVTHSNPYLAKPGEAPVTVYVATCATSGGFIHLYTALDQNILGKYGITAKHVVIRTGTNINLAALGSDEIQFLYCAGDSTIPGMAAGTDATLVGSPLVGLPYVIIARKEIKTIQDLRGKSIGVGSVGGLPFRLLKVFTKKFGLEDAQIRPVGGSQPERYAACSRVSSTLGHSRHRWTRAAEKTVSISSTISTIWACPPSIALCIRTLNRSASVA
jgi:ABC-type nitrate/sulfonate/bicarbonate transport system substrate-binding protein